MMNFTKHQIDAILEMCGVSDTGICYCERNYLDRIKPDPELDQLVELGYLKRKVYDYIHDRITHTYYANYKYLLVKEVLAELMNCSSTQHVFQCRIKGEGEFVVVFGSCVKDALEKFAQFIFRYDPDMDEEDNWDNVVIEVKCEEKILLFDVKIKIKISSEFHFTNK